MKKKLVSWILVAAFLISGIAINAGESSLGPEELTEQISSPLCKNINKYVKN